MMSDAKELAGEVVRLLDLGSSRSAAQERRLSDLCMAFGDYAESGAALTRAAMKGDVSARRTLDSFQRKER